MSVGAPGVAGGQRGVAQIGDGLTQVTAGRAGVVGRAADAGAVAAAAVAGECADKAVGLPSILCAPFWTESLKNKANSMMHSVKRASSEG